MNHALIQNPDGPLTLGVNENNPYKKLPASEEEGGTPTHFGSEVILLTNENIRLAIDLDRQSWFVRMMCMLDFIMNLFNFAFTGMVASALFSIVSLYGYVGAVRYKKSYMIGYLIYQGLLVGARTGAFVFFMYKRFHDHEDIQDGVLIVLPLTALLQVYIFKAVYEYYNKLPNICI